MTDGVLRTTDIILGLIIWIAIWQLATLLTDRLSRSVQIAIWTLVTVVALVLIYKSCCRQADDEKNGKKQEKSAFE